MSIIEKDSFIYDTKKEMFIHKYVTDNVLADYGDGTCEKLNYDAIHVATPFTYKETTYLINVHSYQENRESCLNLMQCLKNNNNIIYSTLIKAIKNYPHDYYPSKWELQRIFKKILLLFKDYEDSYSLSEGLLTVIEDACIKYFLTDDEDFFYKTKFGRGVKQIFKEELPIVYFDFNYDSRDDEDWGCISNCFFLFFLINTWNKYLQAY